MGDSRLSSVPSGLWRSYQATTDMSTRIIDAFIVYFISVACLQLVYCLLTGGFPFNSFLGGFFSCLGMAVTTVSLRMQLASPPSSKSEASPPSKGRALGEWLVCSLVLHVAVFNFIG